MNPYLAAKVPIKVFVIQGRSIPTTMALTAPFSSNSDTLVL